MRWPLQPLQPLQQTQLQPLFGQSVDSLCHPWFTTTNVSYRFPILKLPPPPCAALLVHLCRVIITIYLSIYIYVLYNLYNNINVYLLYIMLLSLLYIYKYKYIYIYIRLLRCGASTSTLLNDKMPSIQRWQTTTERAANVDHCDSKSMPIHEITSRNYHTI